MSESYVMLGKHRIDCPEKYMKALGLVDGQAIDKKCPSSEFLGQGAA